MKDSSSTNSQGANDSAAPQDKGFWPWQRLKGKRISYLTIPLIVMATIVEFVILATGWKYQQVVCVPQGMGVVFFGIGPIGATILAVELLKLPLAMWTASRHGWQKGFMLIIGLPLIICILTFQLVKDMAVYEMTTAMSPATHMLEKAAAEEIKIAHLKAELDNQTKDDNAVKATIEEKKANRDRKLAELAAKQAKAKADLEESLKRNDATRQDAITLTDYQKKELSEGDARQTTIIKQFDADAAQLTKAITELRTRREAELGRATTWNAEEARIENEFKAKMADYTNRKNAYEKDKAEYQSANFLKRKLMKEPVDPGVAPERESNKILKPTLVTELEEQIKAKEAELVAINNKRRDRVAQIDSDARRLREDFDKRSGTKREETDRKREELLAAMALLTKENAAEAKVIDQEFEAATQKEQDALKNQRPVEVVRAELDAARKKAEGFYEQREAAIRNTQVHRIATTVEIFRGWLFGERPLSITASAKARGDLLTDQISMVRIWVYPVLAFIVAFLPTLMVEVGFSTVFQPDQPRPAHRFGFLGRSLHWIETRAGHQKILRAERVAREASNEIAVRDRAIAVAKADAAKARAEKEAEVQAARATVTAAVAEHEDQMKKKEAEWVGKLAGMADSLNRAIVEKDTLRDSINSEVERLIQVRQNSWSDHLVRLRQQLDEQRAANEAERAALIQEHHKKLMEASESSKTQFFQIRRQMGDAELAATEASVKLSDQLKEAVSARDKAESLLKHQTETFAMQLAQVKEDAAREVEKVTRQEKHHLERQKLEFEKTLRQRDDDAELKFKQREQDLSLALEARLIEEKAKIDHDARRREAEIETQFDARARELDGRWKQTVLQREEAAQNRLKQREQEVQTQAEARLSDMQAQMDEELRRRDSDLQRQIEAHSRDAVTRLRQELQQKEVAFQAKLKQREQELATRAAAREAELQNQWASDMRAREEECERQAQVKIRQREQQLQSQFDSRQAESQAQWDQDLHKHQQEWERNAESSARAAESRWTSETQQKEELFQTKLRQRDQHWQEKLAAVRAELQVQNEAELRRRDAEASDERQRSIRELEAHLRKEMQDRHESALAEAKQTFLAQLAVQAEAHQAAEKQWKTELDIVRDTFEPFKAQLSRVEKERDDARHSAAEGTRQVQELKRKLTDVSSLLSSWKNGDEVVGARG